MAETEQFAVVAALDDELRPLVRRLDRRCRLEVGAGRCYAGEIAGHRLLVAATGAGCRAAERGLRALLDHQTVTRLLMIGVAGGLSPDLAPGCLVVARRIHDAAGEAPAPDPPWLERVLPRGDAVAGLFWSAERIVATAAAKEQLWRHLRRPENATVDLESSTYARVAAERGIPFLAIRAVSDTAHETLPLDFHCWLDTEGRVRRVPMAFHALLHPSVVGELLRLARRTRRGTELLADVITEIVAHEDP